MLAERHTQVAGMLELQVPNDMLMERLINRGKTSGRADDNEETIRKRFQVYHSQTAPLAEWFQKEGMRHTFRWAEHPSKEEMVGSIFAFLDPLN